MLKKKKVKPITLRDVTIIDDGKLRKAITAASLGNAMEWFDFGVYPVRRKTPSFRAGI